jgi:hypothetical protein
MSSGTCWQAGIYSASLHEGFAVAGFDTFRHNKLYVGQKR